MKFWEKFWKLVSRKDLVFGILLFAVVIAMTVFETYNKVKVDFSDTAVDIRTGKYSMNIPYEMVESVELTALPDAGQVMDGADDMAARTGLWENETWGEYYICADLNSPICIVAHLEDGRTFVFSRRNEEETTRIYEMFLDQLSSEKKTDILSAQTGTRRMVLCRFVCSRCCPARKDERRKAGF